MGVKGNEAADKLVKQALRATRIEMEISYSRYEIKAIIIKQINQRWQQMWETGNKDRHMKYSQKWGKVGTRVEIEERNTFYPDLE